MSGHISENSVAISAGKWPLNAFIGMGVGGNPSRKRKRRAAASVLSQWHIGLNIAPEIESLEMRPAQSASYVQTVAPIN